MACIVFPSPKLLDHSFPRSTDDLKIVAAALGRLLELRDEGRVIICFPEALSLIVDEAVDLYTLRSALHRDIFRVYSDLFLHSRSGIVVMNSPVSPEKHPITVGIAVNPCVETWSDVLGDALAEHQLCSQESYCDCAGVVDDAAMAEVGRELYQQPYDRAFVLLGPALAGVADVIEDDVPANAHNLGVCIRDIRSNFRLINAVEWGRGTNHYYLKFASGHKWQYQEHCGEPIDDFFLRELVAYSGFSLDLIKYMLTSGKQVPKRIRSCWQHVISPSDAA